MSFMDKVARLAGYVPESTAAVKAREAAEATDFVSHSNALSKGYGAVVDSNFFARGMTLREALAQADSGNIDQAYCKHAVVYAAIQSCALNFSHVPFRFYHGTDLEHDVVENSVYDDVFARPNPFMSRFQLWEATVIYMKLRGECMWVLDFDGGNAIGTVPVGIYPLDPSLFRPVIDKTQNIIVAWEMRTDGNEPIFYEHGTEIIQFKKFNPYNIWRGLAPLEAAARAVKMGQSIRQFNDSLLENGAEPGGVLTAEGSLTPQQMEALRTSFEQRHGGMAKAKRLAILHSGLKYQQIAMSPADMAFKDLDNLSAEDILSVLKVPKTEIFKYDDVRKETAEVQDRALWTKNLLPEMMYIEDELFAAFFSRRMGGKVWGLFDTKQVPALQESLANKVSTATSLFNIGIPLNEINRVLDMGFEPLPWGDVGYLPFSVVPADQLGELRTAPAAPPQEPKQFIGRSKSCGRPGQRWVEKVARPVEAHIEPVSVMPHPLLLSADKALNRARRQAVWQAFVQSVSGVETRFNSRLRRFFFTMRQQVLDELFNVNRGVTKPNLDDIMAESKQVLQGQAKVFYEQSAKLGVERLATFGLSFDLSSVQMQKLVAQRTGRITGIVDTIERQLRRELSEGVQAGESVTQMAGRIRNVFNMSASRALTIARTETSGAANQAGLISMREAQIAQVQWVTAGDEHVRESHQAIDGEIILNGQQFKNGLQYPGQQGGEASEVINCRCTLVPVIEKSSLPSVVSTLPR